MIVADQSQLRSLVQEAGRQADFYHRKRDADVAEFWQELESLAFQARSERRALVIGIQEVKSPLLIMPGEQGQQPRNPLGD